jgi:hypothetical protein
MEGEGELIFVGFDGLTVDLVRPASVISDGSNGTGNVRHLSPFVSFAWGE